MPIMPTNVPARSSFEFGRTADRMPIGTAIVNEMAIANSDSSSVTGRRASKPSTAGSRVRIDRPKSPCRARPSHLTYCTGTGSSSPSSARTAWYICRSLMFVSPM